MKSGFSRWFRGSGAVGMVLILGACGGPRPPTFPAPDSVPSIDPQEVESVIFLLGDAGESYLSTSPLLAKLQRDVEYWSENLARDSSVAMLVLGDIRYPEGVRPRDSSAWPGDTAVVLSQVRVVGGPWGLARGARGLFMAGNHDWGQAEDREGYVRLHNLDELLDLARVGIGADVQLVPEAGTGGPYVLDWGDHYRILLLDTAWWILDATDATRAAQLAEIEAAMESAGDREIIIAGHHPFKSAGSHGGTFSFWRTLGLRYLLHRSGAILEDLTSRPYREFERGLRDVFARQDPPLLFVGGHDHSLQVLSGSEPTDPVINLVSGSGSKLSEIGESPDLIFGQTAAGYMKIVIRNNGDATLFVESVEPRYQACPTTEEARVRCMAEGIAAFRTAFWYDLQ